MTKDGRAAAGRPDSAPAAGAAERLAPDHAVGLSEAQVADRVARGLANALPEAGTKTNGRIIYENVATLFNLFNFAIGAALLYAGAYSNMLFLAVIATNVMIGIVQEIHARNMIEGLSIIGRVKATVIRGGAAEDVPVEGLVLDDVMELTAGSQVCADSTVLAGEVEANESLLTGESDPIFKKAGDALLSGSFIISGRCRASVDQVGAGNYAVRIALEARKHKKSSSRLISSMRRITNVTAFFIVPIAAFMFVEAYFIKGSGMDASIVSTSAALMGMLPKGLVLLVSATLVVGIIKLSLKKILVRELHAIETLSYVDTVCLDKTGTITEGRMTVTGVHEVGGPAMPVPAEEAIGMLVGALDDSNSTFNALRERFPARYGPTATATVPFSSDRKWSGATFGGFGSLVVCAPEAIYAAMGRPVPDPVREAQGRGERVLCLGYGPGAVSPAGFGGAEAVAYLTLDDPIREGAEDTLALFRSEGLDVKLISGDNPLTVSIVSRKVGFSEHESYIDMTGVDAEEDIEAAAKGYSIFGRASPAQKRSLVNALRKGGRTVAMTGDGVNDVLALKDSDVAIAMAAGSDAAKQVSQLVLVDSDFTSLPAALYEGRRVYNNILRFGGVFLIKTIYTVLVSVFCLITMNPFPFAPIQVLLYDLVIEGYPSFILSFEPNARRAEGAFLPTVFRMAAPYAAVILAGVVAMTYLGPLIGLTPELTLTAMYCVTGFVGALAVIRACRPFNPLRAFMAATSSLGFFLGAWLFKGILKVERFTDLPAWVFVSLAAACIALDFIIAAMRGRGRDRLGKDARQG